MIKFLYRYGWGLRFKKFRAISIKELENHAILVKREIPDTIPVGIRYLLTNKGMDLGPILDSLCNWGKSYADGKKIVVPADNNVIDLG